MALEFLRAVRPPSKQPARRVRHLALGPNGIRRPNMRSMRSSSTASVTMMSAVRKKAAAVQARPSRDSGLDIAIGSTARKATHSRIAVIRHLAASLGARDPFQTRTGTPQLDFAPAFLWQ